MTHTTTTCDPCNKHEPEDFQEARSNFNDFIQQLKEKRDKEGFNYDVDQINRFLEADKQISLHATGAFHVYINLTQATDHGEFGFITSHLDFKIVAVDIDMTDAEMALQIKPE